MGFVGFLAAYAATKPYVKYSAALQSPNGVTVTTWQHEQDEQTVDKLSEHVAGDIAKYLSRGFH